MTLQPVNLRPSWDKLRTIIEVDLKQIGIIGG
jgi:hypothetical protein